MRDAYALDSARRDPAPLRHHAGRRRHAGRDRIICTAMSPKGFIPGQDTGQIQGTTELPQDISFDAHGRLAERRPPPMVAAESQRRGLHVLGQRRRQRRGANSGRFFMRLKPRTERKLTPEQVIDGAAPQVGRDPRHRSVFMSNPPLVRIGGAAEPSAVSVHAAVTGLERAVQDGRGLRKQMQKLPGLDRRQQRSADHEPEVMSTSTATAPPPWASRRIRSRARSTTPTARGRCRPFTRPPTTTR